MGDEWVQVIARLVDAEGSNQSRAARMIGVPQQTVGRWLKGGRPDPNHLRMVAKVTDHSIPYLMSVAYDIPLEEMAEGVGADVLPYDNSVNRASRAHLANQYRLLAQLPPDMDDQPEP